MIGLLTPVLYPINRRHWEDAAGPEDVMEIVRFAEHIGIDFVTCGDHGAVAAAELPAYGTARFYDPVATLAWLAAGTSRLQLATYVYQIALRSPLITAKALATVDHLSGGRLIAGFGVGSRRVETEAARVVHEDRGRVADEYVEAVLALWSGAPTTRHGEFVDFDEMVCAPTPHRRPRPPVWIAGKLPASLRRALRFGDAWVMAPWTLGPREVARMLADARATPEWATRTGPPLRVVAAVAPLGGRAPRGCAPPPLRAADARAVEAAVEEIRGWAAAGATDYVLDLPAASSAELQDALSWFVEDVLPAASMTTGVRT